MSNPLVSVILPVYNRPSVLYTINSVLKQTYQNFELLIVDNASTDETQDVIKKIKDKRIRLVINEVNRGQTYSINRGLRLARGIYIARIDADDLMLPTRLEKQVAFMEQYPEYGLCGSWVQYITDDNRKAIIVKTCTSDLSLRAMQRIACGVYHPAVMMRADLLKINHIEYNNALKMAEDYDMWRQILKYSKGKNLPEVLVYYRKGANNDSDKHRATTNQEGLYIREKICKEDGTYPGRIEMEQILEIEKKDYISLFRFFRCYCLYMRYLKKNIIRSDENYSIIKRRILSTLLGTCIRDNKALWSHFFYSLYLRLRYLRYKVAKAKVGKMIYDI